MERFRQTTPPHVLLPPHHLRLAPRIRQTHQLWTLISQCQRLVARHSRMELWRPIFRLRAFRRLHPPLQPLLPLHLLQTTQHQSMAYIAAPPLLRIRLKHQKRRPSQVQRAQWRLRQATMYQNQQPQLSTVLLLQKVLQKRRLPSQLQAFLHPPLQLLPHGLL